LLGIRRFFLLLGAFSRVKYTAGFLSEKVFPYFFSYFSLIFSFNMKIMFYNGSIIDRKRF
jgi:hypothetical protein